MSLRRRLLLMETAIPHPALQSHATKHLRVLSTRLRLFCIRNTTATHLDHRNRIVLADSHRSDTAVSVSRLRRSISMRDHELPESSASLYPVPICLGTRWSESAGSTS